MTRTTIRKDPNASNYVTLRYVDDMGDVRTEEFMVPHSGGYVRDGHGNQVCVGLSNRGSTLTATDGDDLLKVIRREWKRRAA